MLTRTLALVAALTISFTAINAPEAQAHGDHGYGYQSSLPKFGFKSFNIHGYGERITAVRWNGLADRLGLEQGDIILAVNGYHLTYNGAWFDALAMAMYHSNEIYLEIEDVRTGFITYRMIHLYKPHVKCVIHKHKPHCLPKKKILITPNLKLIFHKKFKAKPLKKFKLVLKKKKNNKKKLKLNKKIIKVQPKKKLKIQPKKTLKINKNKKVFKLNTNKKVFKLNTNKKTFKLNTNTKTFKKLNTNTFKKSSNSFKRSKSSKRRR